MVQDTLKKILLVDDSNAMRAYLKELLLQAFPECVVVEASTMTDGLMVLTGQNNRSAASGEALWGVVTDFMLGENGQTGLEMLNFYAKGAEPAVFKRLPKVLITQGGKLSPTELALTQKLGIVVLPKPTQETAGAFIVSLQRLLTLC